MQTIRLRVNENIYKHLMWFLKRFSKDELQIIEEDTSFSVAQKELKEDLNQLEKGETQFLDLKELDEELEATIRKYEA